MFLASLLEVSFLGKAAHGLGLDFSPGSLEEGSSCEVCTRGMLLVDTLTSWCSMVDHGIQFTAQSNVKSWSGRHLSL